MKEFTPLESSWIVYRAEKPEESITLYGRDWVVKQAFEAGWKACESARRREALQPTVEPSESNEAAKPTEANQKLIKVLESLEYAVTELQLDSPTCAYSESISKRIVELEKLLCSTEPPSPAKE